MALKWTLSPKIHKEIEGEEMESLSEMFLFISPVWPEYQEIWELNKISYIIHHNALIFWRSTPEAPKEWKWQE